MLKTPTLNDLYDVEGQAELVNGQIVRYPFHGRRVAHACMEIMVSLRVFTKTNKLSGRPFSSTVGFVVDLPHRKSFCADVSYYVGPSSGMKFPVGAPRFAVEIRDESDDSSPENAARIEKRRDYFAAGTLVVWDVDLLSDTEIVRVFRRVFRNGQVDVPAAIHKRGDLANAEPAVPGWTIAVNDLFE